MPSSLRSPIMSSTSQGTYLAKLPFSKRKALCSSLDMNAKWHELASELGYDSQAIHHFGMALYRLKGFNSPSEDLITEYCHRNPTIEELYFKLKKLNLGAAAAIIEEYVSKAAVQAGDFKSLKGPGEHDTGGLPTPSQRPIHLKVQNQQGPTAFGYTHDPFSSNSSSNNSSSFASTGNGSDNGQLPAQPPSYQLPMHTPVQSAHYASPQQQQQQVPQQHNMGVNQAAAPAGYSFKHVGQGNPSDLDSAAPVYYGNQPPRKQYQPAPQLEPLRIPQGYGQISGQFSGQFVNTNGPHIPYYQQQRTQQQNNRTFEALNNNSDHMDLSYMAIKRATLGFDKRHFESQDRFGVVFWGKQGNKLIAVKQMRKIVDEKSGFDITTHLLKEVDVLKKCNHANIVRLLHYIDAQEGEGNVYLIYPHMEKGSLRKQIKENNSFKWEFRIKILMQAASGLVYLHDNLAEQPYIHGDISSENILLDANMTAKLSGFGLAQAATGGGNDYEQKTHVSQAYLKNTLFGAKEYLPPEFKDIPELSVKGDVFAFGVVILETCTGLAPYDERREGGKLLWQYVDQMDEKFAESLNDKRQPMPTSVWQKVFEIGRKCISLKKKHRPLADKVRQSLDDIVRNDMRRNSKTGMNNKTATEQTAVSVVQTNQDDRPQTPFYAGTTSPLAAQNTMYSHHTPLKQPVDYGEQINSVHEGQRPAMHPQYSIVSPDFDKGYGMFSAQSNAGPGEGTCYGGNSEESQEDKNDTDEIIFERPGNTMQHPVFVTAQMVTDPNVKINHEAGAHSETYQTGSDYSTYGGPIEAAAQAPAMHNGPMSQTSCNDYDFRQSDMEIFSGSSSGYSASKPAEIKPTSGDYSADLSSCATTNQIDSSSQPTTDNNEHVYGFDYRKNDLDILSGASSSRKSSKMDSSLSHDPISSTSTNYSQSTGYSPDDVPKTTASGYFASASSAATTADSFALKAIGLNMGSLSINDKVSHNHNELPVAPIGSDSAAGVAPALPHNLDFSDLPTPFAHHKNDHTRQTAETTPEHVAPENNPDDPAGPESLLDDPVQLNHSVIQFIDNSRYTSETTNASDMLPSHSTLDEGDFSFTHLTPDDDPVVVAGAIAEVAAIDSRSETGAQYNMSTMLSKAEDMFDFGDDDDTCISLNDGGSPIDCPKDFSWQDSLGLDDGLGGELCDAQM